jgi:hypothetical protein
MSSAEDPVGTSVETGRQFGRMEPVLNVGRQCAVYLVVVATLAGGVAFFGPFERRPAEAGDSATLPLAGDFTMLAPLDATEDAAPRTVASFYVTGRAAQEMWDAFPMEPVADECVGRLSKYGNGMVCYGANGDGSVADPAFECTFGIDMKTQSLTLSHDC